MDIKFQEASTPYWALLGALPGCGGAIFLMPLYVKGQVSFGAVVSTLIATAGDSAFVLLSTGYGNLYGGSGNCWVYC